MKTIENACAEKYHDLSIDRIRRMIRSVLKVHKSQPKDHSTTTNRTKNRSNLTGNTSTNKSVSSIERSDGIYPSVLVGFGSIPDIDITVI